MLSVGVSQFLCNCPRFCSVRQQVYLTPQRSTSNSILINVRPAHIFQGNLWSLILTPDPSSQLEAQTATNLEFRSNWQTPVTDTEVGETYLTDTQYKL